MHTPAPDILGHLLLIQGTLHVMTEPKRLAEFLCAGLARVPGVGTVGLCLRGELLHCVPESALARMQQRAMACDCGREPSQHAAPAAPDEDFAIVFELKTALASYGCMQLNPADREALECYLPFLENLANTVALLLETREQRKRLLRLQEDLEQRVELRTAELRASNRSLAEREHFIHRVSNTAPSLIYIYDIVEQRNVYCNDASDALLGISAEQMKALDNRLFTELVHPDDLLAIGEHQQRLANAADSDVLEIAYRVRHGEDSWRTLQSYEVVFARDADGRPTQTAGTAIDVSDRVRAEGERRQMEEQLRHAQRVESIGRLAGGVAHDLNNLLTPILGLSGFVLSDLPADSPSRSDVEEIQQAAERCRKLTQQLLAFGRKQILEVKRIDLNELVADIGRMLHRVLRENIALELRHADTPVFIDADAAQIGQVLLNLAVNAQDAMPENGSLTFSVAVREVEAGSEHDFPGHRAGSYAVVEVEDTGAGIEPDLLGRIFDPFFTTKGPGLGTGLGLSTAHGIAAQHGGHISVRSHVGSGTKFSLLLPLSSRRERVASLPPPGEVAATLRDMTVLVAEDDASVRTLLVRMLERKGLRILAARSGEEAMAIARGYHGEIHVLVSDLIMPGMSGAQLFEELSPLRPKMRVLFITGYPADTLQSHRFDISTVNLLAKPFTVEALFARLADTLGIR